MIYSSWQPDRGGYAYYETPERRGLGDDLPTPRLTNTTSIGVASTDIGRPLPRGAKLVGYGALARGSVTVTDRSGLGTSSGAAAHAPMLIVLAVGALGGYFLVTKLR